MRAEAHVPSNCRFSERDASLWRARSIPSGRRERLSCWLPWQRSPPRSLSRERLAEAAWPKPDSASANAVYAAVSRLRAQLPEQSGNTLVRSDGQGYRLGIAPGCVDAIRFETAARALLRPERTLDEQ